MSKKCTSDKECGPDKICSGVTSRCIGTDTRTGKKEIDRRSGGKPKVVKSPKKVVKSPKKVVKSPSPKKRFKRLKTPESDSDTPLVVKKKVLKRLKTPESSDSDTPLVKKKVLKKLKTPSPKKTKRRKTPSPVSSSSGDSDSDSDDALVSDDNDLGSDNSDDEDNDGSFIVKSPRVFSPCSSGKIRNPLTGHCVSKKGAIGKKILDGTLSKKKKPAEKPITSFKLCKGVKCDETKIWGNVTRSRG